MKIGIIDADLIGKKNHRFPNLASMKISGWHKRNNDDVLLITDYEKIRQFDKVYLSKVFMDTPVPEWVLKSENLVYGGTGFFYDKAPRLSDEIEFCFPDYHLYDEWIDKIGDKGSSTKYYKDYSIGFTTRGCFRQCPFCVNRNYKRVEPHSHLDTFVDKGRKKICLLDDNILAFGQWKRIFEELNETGKRFQFKQGMDERLLTPEKCKVIFNSNYDGDYIFAFDNIEDYALIEEKLKLLRDYTNKIPKFYVFCGFDRIDKWDVDFWKQDIFDMMKRIELLAKYRCLPYIMRFNRYIESPYQGVYKTVAAWCNQPSFFKKKSLREFGIASGEESARNRYIVQFEKYFHHLDTIWILNGGHRANGYKHEKENVYMGSYFNSVDITI